VTKKEAKNCWSYWNCDSRTFKDCPSWKYTSGKRCWDLAGTGCKEPYCILLKKEFRYCWECPWFRKVNPDFFKKS